MRVKSRDADGLFVFIYSPDATHLNIELQLSTTCTSSALPDSADAALSAASALAIY